MTAGRSVYSQSQNWGTPPHYVAAVREALGGGIALDPCSNEHSVVHADTEYRLPQTDGLHASWDARTIYCNPPYGADRERGTKIRDWLRRCADAHRDHGAEVIALVPVATNTLHWKRYVWDCATSVAFLYDTRLKFLVDGRAGGKGAPMSCAMVYWGSDHARFFDVFARFGAVVDVRPLHISYKLRAAAQPQQLLFGAESTRPHAYGRTPRRRLPRAAQQGAEADRPPDGPAARPDPRAARGQGPAA